MVLFLEKVFSALIIRFFLAKIQRFFKVLKSLKDMMKKCFLEKKTFSSFEKLSLQEWEGGKYAGGAGGLVGFSIQFDTK